MLAFAYNRWWTNWPKTFGFVCPLVLYPRSLSDISDAIAALDVGQTVKAVGGGWSFTDASLPFPTQGRVDHVSTLQQGGSATADLSRVLQGLPAGATAWPIDFVPEEAAEELAIAMHYDQATTTQQTQSASLPMVLDGFLIDTRGLASSLQDGLPAILSPQAQPQPGAHYFHVEAGITMADLQQLLDHQKPRLAIQATGGNPLATLAGSLSTATHGGEFRWPLLVDRVRAIHIVGPGGVEWWIEGDAPVADQAALQTVYPKLDADHFIGGAWSAISGLTAQDVLKAAVVSMGTLGVIYSVVIEVVEQYGLQQIVRFTSWAAILAAAGTTEAELRAGSPSANLGVLDVLMDGARNGTAIPLADNVYVDLAINPFVSRTSGPIAPAPEARECWITNRRLVAPLDPNHHPLTLPIPLDANNPAAGAADYVSAISNALIRNATDTVGGDALLGRIFDFLYYATGAANWPDDIINHALPLIRFILQWPDALNAVLALISAQAVANVKNADTFSHHPDRGFSFLADLLTGILHSLQGTRIRFQFGDLVKGKCEIFQGKFRPGAAGQQILFYAPGDDNWWLGTFKVGGIDWSRVGNSAAAFGHAINDGRPFWIGNFVAAGQDSVLFYFPGDDNWWVGTLVGSELQWSLAANTAGFVAYDGRPFWIGDFNHDGRADVLFYHPADDNWWLGTFTGTQLKWSLAGNTAGFGHAINDGRPFWIGDFVVAGQASVLFYSPGDANWWVGTLVGSALQWSLAANTAGFTANDGRPFWIGDFNCDGRADVLFYHPADDNWWLGIFAGTQLQWSLVGNTAGFGHAINDGRPFWIGDFAVAGQASVLFYHPGDDNWFIGTLASGGQQVWSLAGNSAALSSGIYDGRPFWTGDFNGDGRADVLFYYPANGDWWLGTLVAGTIAWRRVSNTTYGINPNSDKTDVSYKVGAVGWPDGGIPGRGLEIALDPSKAFSFLQSELFDDLLGPGLMTSPADPRPLLGYISIRVCPQTATLMGMQQFSPQSVMVEIVGYRSPESDTLMDTIQARVIDRNANQGLNAMLHWGLENDQLTAGDLANMPLNQPIHPGSSLSKLATFQAVREFLRQGNTPIFDNNFTRRLQI